MLINFLRFSFFANTSLGHYKSGHVGEGLAAAFYSYLFRESTENTLQLGHPGLKRRKNGSFFLGGLAGVQAVKNSWWLAGWPAGTTSAFECLRLAC